MMSLFCTSKRYSLWFRRLCTIAASCVWLTGCSGGISGTGDGGPIVVIDPTASEQNTDASPDGTVSGNSGAQTAFNHQVFPQQLTTQFSTAALSALNLNDRISGLPEVPVAQKISSQLNAITQQNRQAQLDLANIEEFLLDTLEQCDSSDPCSSVPDVITTTLSSNTLEFQQSLQPLATPAEGDQFTYSNISYTRETAGYFDQKLKYTNQNGTDVALKWTADNQLISIQTENNTIVTYALTDLRQSTTTLRTENKATGTIFHAEIKGTVATGTTIEADWHSGEQQHYVRATADETSITLYAIHPTDFNASRTRETFDVLAGNYVIESCTAGNRACDDWQTVANNGTAIGARLTATEPTLGDFSLSISSNIQVNLPAEVNEFVIATGIDSAQPEPLSLVCGGQRVQASVRTFCWQPLPLAGAIQFYEETTGNGSPSYQQLADAQVR